MQKRAGYVGCKENTSVYRDGVLLFEHNYLCLDLANDRFRCISRNNLGVVQHVELLGGITAGVQKDGLLASRVVRQELKNTS